jgi:hypothetical protein
MDMWHGTYRKCEIKAYDIHYWQRWAEDEEKSREDSRKWMAKESVPFEKVHWGF